MDTSDPDIVFAGDEGCSHCLRARRLVAHLPTTADESKARLDALAGRVRKNGEGREYDCLVGLSGGVDSSYVALLAARLGLRVLAVHFDNGWNSEIAVANIQKLCETLGIDLMTFVIDWAEFRDLQRSFLLASVIDVELVTDHAIFASMLNLSRRHRIPTILSGTNFATESILPRSWVWPKQDRRNIEGIHRRFGTVPLRTFPMCGILRWSTLRYSPLGPDYAEPLNAAQYRKTAAMKELEAEVGWRYYGGKHHESTFTKFYQCTLLPEKFGVDKRRAHLSSLVVNNEITRAEALEELARPLYQPGEQQKERAYVLKKLGFSDADFDAIMTAPIRRHDEYPSSARFFRAVEVLRERTRERHLAQAHASSD
ncbi:MAG: N-acetyl sugar amidotransferase [Actinomycetota bacterium]|nr:N-acetyl sugar amidotransferase [Actinomycetota bacterium]